MGNGTSAFSGVSVDDAVTGAVADLLADAPRVCVNVAVRDRRDRDTVKNVGVADGDDVRDRLVDALAVADDVTVYGDAEALGDPDRLGDADTLCDRVDEPLIIGVTVALRDLELLRDALRVVDGKTLGDTEADAVTDADVDAVKGDAETRTDLLGDGDGESEPDFDGEAERVGDLVADLVAFGEGVAGTDALALRVNVTDTDLEAVLERVAVADALAVREPLPLGDRD